MKGLKLIQRAINLQEVKRIPWVPFVGVHAAKLINKNASEFLKSEELIYKGVSEAITKYNPDGIPILFDLQLEAEVLGCELIWADENPPSVVSHPLQKGILLSDLRIPNKTDGRIGITLNAAKRIKNDHPDLAVYGLITGPFTLALHLLGTDIFMKMFMEPDEIRMILDFCTAVGKKMSEYYIEAGCDVIAVVDPMTSQIDPMNFNQFVSPYVSEIFTYIRSREKISSFFVCGNAEQNIEEMCKCKPDNISIDENIDLEFVKNITLKHKISFGGNIKLTVSLLLGNENDCQADALSCMDKGGLKGFILAPGCDIPMDTPVINLQAVSNLVFDEYQQQVIRTMDNADAEETEIDLTGHWKPDKLNIDIFTLDSSSCAPCKYMVEAVNKIIPEFGKVVEIKEFKIKELESIKMMRALKVKNIPSICIEGEVVFSSQIPPREKLITAVKEKLDQKFAKKING
ncbi:MAG: thioredoxin family protein [Melioribacteraceae bacterium]|nr:thioredoxin family protein [Melioribacteraceae bacterium]